MEISVIMPIYNAEKTLEKSIGSLINQNFELNYEIILINDGSIDNSEKICKKFQNKYKNIKYKKIKNCGVSTARNIGIELASGEYIMFIDSDDTYDVSMLKKMYNVIKKNDMAICGYNRVTLEKNQKIEKKISAKEYERTNFNQMIEICQKNQLFNQIWNKIYSSKILKENNIRFNENISLGEDYSFLLDYIEYCNNVIIISDCLYNYINTTTGLNLRYRKNRMEIDLQNMKKLEKYYESNNFSADYINKKYIQIILSGLNNICKNSNKNEISSELQKFIENSLIREKIRVKINFKYDIITYLLRIKSKKMLKVYGHILRVYDKYKKKKLGY
jgi:glycosyltransferase involved in cell wall biosynthesis